VASTIGSGSQDPKLVGSPKVGVAAGSQLLEASPTPERQAGPNNATGSQPPEANSGPGDLDATMPRPPEAFLDPGSHGPSGPLPMEVDEPDPQGGSILSSAWCTMSVRSSMMPKQGI
jgi:hypothetical protein